MAELLLTAPGSRVSRHGPVTPQCPVECRLTVFNPLARSCEATFAEPRTGGDVLGLHERGQLREIRGIGPRRVLEIEAALAGFDLGLACQQRPRAGRPARPGASPPAQDLPENRCP